MRTHWVLLEASAPHQKLLPEPRIPSINELSGSNAFA